MPRRKMDDKKRKPRRNASSTGGSKRSRHLHGVTDIEFRDINLLRRFVTQQGKIMPARLTGATSKQQRQIARSVRRARVMGLLP